MNKEVVVLNFDYFQGAIMLSDIDTGEPLTGIDVIDNDEEIKKLNYALFDLYFMSVKFNEENIPIGINKEIENKNKTKIIELLEKLNKRLLEINDGTFEVEDRLTTYYKSL